MKCSDCGTTQTDTWFFPDGEGMPVGPALCTECMSAKVKAKVREWGVVLSQATERLRGSFNPKPGD